MPGTSCEDILSSAIASRLIRLRFSAWENDPAKKFGGARPGLACLPRVAHPINASVSSAEASASLRKSGKLPQPNFRYENRILVFSICGLSIRDLHAPLRMQDLRGLFYRDETSQRVLFTSHVSQLDVLLAGTGSSSQVYVY
jgi:hypothetical protein